MSDALPLPPRPDLDQYKKLARELQRAAGSAEPDAFRRWASRWLETLARLRSANAPADAADPLAAIAREAERVERQWRDFVRAPERAHAIKLTDAQFFIARAHGFASWPAFAAHIDALTQDTSPVAIFEAAVDAIVSGDAARLKRLLQTHPELARARSTRDHRSTLLHYISANGVEDFRQVTPKNVVAMTEMLLEAGADVNAASDAYGGGATALGLTATSIHPEQAGVQIELLETLLRHGARIEGEQAGNRSGLVLGCLANGQPRAARFFADRGAPLSLVEAAGVGLLDRVRACFDENDGRRQPSPSSELDSALEYAAGYGHADVVTYLLNRGANPSMSDDAGQTPLHWATFGPHVEVTRALLRAGADVSARDRRFGATPLDWMVHAWANADAEDSRSRGQQVASLLIEAGAVPDLDRFDPQVLARVRVEAAMRDALGLPPEPETTRLSAPSSRVVRLDISTPEINICSLTRDGRLALVASQGNPVGIWDAQTGQRVLELGAGSSNAWLAQWTPHPTCVLVASRQQNTIELWEIERRESVMTLRGHHGGQPRAAATNDAGTSALTGCSHRDTTIRLWDLESGACLRILDGHRDGIYSIAWYGETRAASGSRDRTIRIWDVESGATLRALTGHTYHVHSVAWSRDGRRLLSSSMDIRLWDVESGRLLRVFGGHSAVIRTVVWSPDEKYALSASHDGTARIWDVESGRCEYVLHGHDAGLVSAAFSTDGQRAFTCDWLGAIREWPLTLRRVSD
ncbi:MAG TPA: ankyrin repeat domain-containing protein [Vicinamibacterales bacterium]